MIDSDAGELSNDVSPQRAARGDYFAYDASLRIFGVIPDIDRLSEHLGVRPTKLYRRGEQHTTDSIPQQIDVWMYTAPIDETKELHLHIDALWEVFRDKKQYLLKLKEQHGITIDVFLGYRSSCDHAGLEIPHQSLEIFTELEVPFGLSIITS